MGVVLDYQAINSDTSNFSFRGDTTYYVSASVNLFSDGNHVRGGTVIKFGSSGSLNTYSSLVCEICFRIARASFTSKDDNSIGEPISGSTGSPTTGSTTYLNIVSDSTKSPEYCGSPMRL